MTKIDKNTGLPALQENQFWRVVRASKTVSKGYYGSTTRHNVGKVQLVERTVSTRKGLFRTVSSVGEVILHETWIQSPISQDHYDRIYVIQSYDYTINADTILRAATEIVNSLEAIRLKEHADKIAREQAARAKAAEEKRIAALLGDYPPKRLALTK